MFFSIRRLYFDRTITFYYSGTIINYDNQVILIDVLNGIRQPFENELNLFAHLSGLAKVV